MKTKKLVQMINELDIEMCWINKKTHGNVNLATGKIKLNVETMVVEVLTHEVMHLIHPLLNTKKDEEVIDDLTARTYARYTEKQIREMARKLLKG